MRVGAMAADAPHGGTMMRPTTRWICSCTAVAGLLASACAASSGTVVPAELGREAPPPSVSILVATTSSLAAALDLPATTFSDVTDPTVGPPATGTATEPLTTVPSPAGPGVDGPRFSDALGDQIDAAPAVRTRGDTRRLLEQGLYVHLAWEPDPTDASVFTPLAEDVPILEAYTNAQIAYYRAALGLSPPDDPMLDRYFVDGSTRFAPALARRADAGLSLQLGSGVVLRPYVLGDQRSATTAVVLDCYLHDEQEVPVGTTAAPGPLRTYGLVATMVLIDGAWKLDRTGTETGVCL